MEDPRVAYFSSPVGHQKLEATPLGLRSACFVASPRKGAAISDPLLARALVQLEEYFARCRLTFDIPLDLTGQPPFRRAVLSALAQRVPAGEVVSYGKLAAMAGSPRGARAVGGAMASNPLPIFIPCHRVVARNSLGGLRPGPAREAASPPP